MTAYGVKTNPGAFCFWQVDPSGVTLWLDLRNGGNGVELGKRTLLAATIVTEDYEKQSPFQAARQFCRKMADRGIFMPAPLYGGNNWYYAYGNSSADAIRADTERIASYSPSGGNRPFMVIDDGWSPYRTTGPWAKGNTRFPDMAALASDMQGLGVKPGLWFRPLTTRESVPENWLLKRTSQQMRTLDPTVEGAAEQIRSDVRLLCSWGYQLLKHDFSTYDLLGRWGFQMAAELTDAGLAFGRPQADKCQIFRALYALLREAAGAIPLLGCNTVGHLATGLFEVQRTGDDTSGRDWSRTRKMGVNTLAFRAAQQGAFFDVDADSSVASPMPSHGPSTASGLICYLGAAHRSSSPPRPRLSAPSSTRRSAKPSRAPRYANLFVSRSTGSKQNEPGHWRLGSTIAAYDWYTDALSIPSDRR